MTITKSQYAKYYQCENTVINVLQSSAINKQINTVFQKKFPPFNSL